MSDLISRQAVLNLFATHDGKYLYEAIQNLPLAEPERRWTPVSERLPEECEEVNITWVNNNPESYYSDIKGVPKTGRWIIKDNPGMGWYRVTCSECWEDVTSAVPIIGFLPNAKVIWDYCPYCGAKMEG